MCIRDRLVLVFGIILGFMLEPLTHIDPVYVCCVLALLSYCLLYTSPSPRDA